MPFSRMSFRIFLLLILASVCNHALSESGRPDYDLDDDGLIEINDLEDLDQIREDEEGESLYGESVGCDNADGCFGYELTTDLDFDTNGDGVMDENDTYWRDGAGWKPIGTVDPAGADPADPDTDQSFSAIFEGNDYQIKNLYVRARTDDSLQAAGLFGGIQGNEDDPDTDGVNEEEIAEVRNLHLTGDLTEVFGNSSIGVLAGAVAGAEITNVTAVGEISTPGGPAGGLIGAAQLLRLSNSSFEGTIFGDDDTGGLIGNAQSVEMKDSYALADIFGDDNTGGLVGYASQEVGVFTSFVRGKLRGDDYVGGIIGYAGEGNGIDNAIADVDIEGENYVGGLIGFIEDGARIGRSYHKGDLDSTGYIGGLIGYVYDDETELLVSYWTKDISGIEDAVGWGEVEGEGYFDATEKELRCPTEFATRACKIGFPLYIEWDTDQDVWDLGSSDKLPALIIDGVVYRDIDSDGILDQSDDSDGDGVNDHEDSLPFNADRSEPNVKGTVTISGDAAEFHTLVATVSDDDGFSGDVYYVWLTEDADGNLEGVNDRGNIYIPQSKDVGKTIKVYAQYEDEWGFKESVESEKTDAVISLEDKSWNDITGYADGGEGERPDPEDYVIVLDPDTLSEERQEEIGYLASVISRYVANSAAEDVDEKSEIEAIIDFIETNGGDNDGDGLPNILEGNDDIDGDGLANKDDEDSDGDNIPDEFELDLDLTDSDFDGIIDLFDADADGDGELDTKEEFDQLPQDRVDNNFDGVDDNFDTTEELIAENSDADLDSDGLINSYDIDSDGDGVTDNNDASNSNEDDVAAGGAGSMSALFLLLIAAILVLARKPKFLAVSKNKTLVPAFLVAFASLYSVQSHAEFSVSIAGGQTHFDPELGDSLSEVDSTSVGFQFDAAYFFRDQFAFQLSATDLGALEVESELASPEAGEAHITYRSYGAHFIIRPTFMSMFEWVPHVRLGGNHITVDTRGGVNAAAYEEDFMFTFAAGIDRAVKDNGKVEILFHSFSEDLKMGSIGYRHFF